MNDRELIEMAAKAVGIELHVWGTMGAENFAAVNLPNSPRWNPIEDDGQALRLAVGLGIQVWRDADVIWCGGVASVVGDDPEADVRLAIVRAAAELGAQPNATALTGAAPIAPDHRNNEAASS